MSVVGVKDEKYGETVAAFVIKNGSVGNNSLTEKEVQDWVKDRMSKVSKSPQDFDF